MDTTIDEIRAGWEQMREMVRALQLTAQFYAEQIQQQITEKETLIDKNRLLVKEHNILVAENRELQKVLDAMTTTAFTRENLEKSR